MTIAPETFKAYDIRGLYPQEIDEAGAHELGRAFAELVTAAIGPVAAPRIAVGHDVRLSSPSIADAFCAGAVQGGAHVTELGLCATEMVYFAVADGNYDGGAQITASHNPPQYTGAKLVLAGALPLSGETGISELGRRIASGDLIDRPGGTRTVDPGVLDRFLIAALGFVEPERISGLRVVFDGANGMAGLFLRPVIAQLDIDAVECFLDPDGRFPHHEPNPLLPENRAFIEAKVVEEHADLGIAFDGDADRCFFIDDRGEFVPGDFLTALLATHLLTRTGPADVIYDLRASWAVREAITNAEGRAHEYRVGHAFIKRGMRELDAVFAGEVSGHYYFRDFSYADSGLIPALLVLEMLSNLKVPLSSLIDEYRSRFHISGEINSTVADATRVMATLRERYADGAQREVDGLSVDYADWHFNVRSSNTEPLVRLNLESLISDADMQARRDEVLAIIRDN